MSNTILSLILLFTSVLSGQAVKSNGNKISEIVMKKLNENSYEHDIGVTITPMILFIKDTFIVKFNINSVEKMTFSYFTKSFIVEEQNTIEFLIRRECKRNNFIHNYRIKYCWYLDVQYSQKIIEFDGERYYIDSLLVASVFAN